LTADPATGNGNTVANSLANEHAAGQTMTKDTAPQTQSVDAPPRGVQLTNDPSLHETRGITSVQIAGNAAQSEIHLAMQADKLGAVELHAQVAGEQVGAALVVEKKEAHAALAAELPELQQALAEKNLRVEHVWLTQGSLHATSGDAGNAAGQQFRNHPGSPYVAEREEDSGTAFAAGAIETEGIFDERGHLSVRV
jgi:flagellar hook-length control protein FliK